MVPEFFSFVDVANMYFDHWSLECVERIEDRYRRVRECRRIDHDPTRSSPGFVNPIDDFVLAIALMKDKFEIHLASDRATVAFYLGEGGVTVDFWLSLTKKIQVGTIQHHDPAFHRCFLSSDWIRSAWQHLHTSGVLENLGAE
jgi:hypothetical protein